LLALLELAWHDTSQEGTPPEDLIDDILLLSEGNLRVLIRWSRIAVADGREVRAAAENTRSHD
jgi:hypothetical protein